MLNEVCDMIWKLGDKKLRLLWLEYVPIAHRPKENKILVFKENHLFGSLFCKIAVLGKWLSHWNFFPYRRKWGWLESVEIAWRVLAEKSKLVKLINVAHMNIYHGNNARTAIVLNVASLRKYFKVEKYVWCARHGKRILKLSRLKSTFWVFQT